MQGNHCSLKYGVSVILSLIEKTNHLHLNIHFSLIELQ